MMSICDVVKLASVSPLTVPGVTNGMARVDDEKRQKVERTTSETGFKPNKVARSLYKRPSEIIDILVSNIINPSFDELAGAMEEECDRRGYRPILCNPSGDLEKEKRNLSLPKWMDIDRVILITNMDEIHREAGNCQIPIVIIDRQIEGSKGTACIRSNHYQGGRISMEHPLERDCKHIVQMNGSSRLSSTRKHYQGYLDVCGEWRVGPACIEGNYDSESGAKVAEWLLEEYPDTDGIIAANDVAVISVYKELHREGIRVSGDTQLIGFDNISLGSLSTLEITTTARPAKGMGQDAARMLTEYVVGA